MDRKNAIFDMDGTLLDSMNYWRGLGREYLTKQGCSPTAEQLARVRPMTMLQSGGYFHDLFLPDKEPAQIVEEMNAMMDAHYRKDIPLKSGVRAYLEKLQERSVRLCVATATDEALATACLKRLKVFDLFNFLVSCETIGKSKREPDIYNLAARRLCPEAAHREIAVYEDYYECAQTARGAGYYTVGIFEPVYEDDWAEMTRLCDETYMNWAQAMAAL